ncbi:flavodoxin [Megasphaera cerevisiae DSM 20462]|jgi:flavorubredoxin|uniref:Flavodoxin n=1 Tax=Megasphaera cerevisiae DSM 20462 TaxID=1122219 RepID=A0A0J6WXK1_9FIRM|nr:FprA family A-type flavoprotein [Megasphaera cerevisiae]KMO86958.1 flavodoxin [Megasphaera cerevisiae DSM 20462]OKY54087.1 flavodoxin [Megasphaera cerevisiae]SJZ56443.1 Flavorubredoxin [Megasphaera cerevisiae DSM 20462]
MYCVEEIKNGIYWMGCNDFRTELFERIFPIPEGITYNSYFIDDEKTCVLDAMDKSCRDEFLENVEHLLHGRKLDYFVLQHMEPDHASSALALIEKYPDVKIIGQPQTFKLFEQFFRHPCPNNYVSVKEGDQLALGKHTLQFIKAPMVHWPEVIMSYDLTDKMLFSADAFGMFGTTGNVYADQVDFEENYLDPARRYYVNIVGKFGPQVVNVLKKASGIPIDVICPLHGVVFRTPETIQYIVKKYQHWAQYVPEKKGVVIAFSSIYGNTERAACVLAHKLSQQGIHDVRLYDVAKIHPSYITAKAWEYSHLVLAAPTYNLNLFLPMESFLHDLKTLLFQKRKIAIIANHSWASAAYKTMVDYVEDQFKCCELIEPALDMKSSLCDDQECIVDEMALRIAEDIKAYPDPETLI